MLVDMALIVYYCTEKRGAAFACTTVVPDISANTHSPPYFLRIVYICITYIVFFSANIISRKPNMRPQQIKRVCVAISMAIAFSAYAQITPVNLMVEHLDENILINPPKSQNENPRFSWINKAAADAVGEEQKAYRICVATSARALASGKADVWDSRKVKSPESYLVDYRGEKLAEATDYYWRVKVWNAKGKASKWSETQKFTTGISTWKARWIGAPWQGEEAQFNLKTGQCAPDVPAVPYLRKAFDVRPGIRSAKAFVTGLGYFEFFLNGSKVGNDLLVPNFTNYTSRPDLKYRRGISLDEKSSGFRVSYLQYDITKLLQNGKNAVGAMVASGYFDSRSDRLGAFGSPRFICQIEITYIDGSRQVVVSDQSWKACKSGIVSCDIYDGERYDARREVSGWCDADFDDSMWENAVERKVPEGKLVAFDTNPDRVTETLTPVAFKSNADGSCTIDFGEMISGHVRLKNVSGEKDKTIKIKYESAYPQEVRYTFKDNTPIDYAPQFTWYVFRRVTIYGFTPTADQIVAEAVNTDMKVNSEFTTSNELFNKINHVWQRTEKDNLHSGVESDCPHRERIPYTGDGQAVCSTVMHNFNGAAFFRSWFNTMRDTQDRETGYLPNAAPWCPGAGGGVAWGAALSIMPWEHYMNYGDKRVVDENYDASKRQIDYMITWVRPDGTMHQKRKNAIDNSDCYWLNLGDWVPPFKFPADEKVHTYILWRCADRMSKMAKVMGKGADEKRYRDLAERTRNAYDKVFFENDTLGYGDFGCNAFAVEMGLDKKRPGLKHILAHEIGNRHNGHLNCGYIALEVLLEALAKTGMNNLAYTVMNKTDYPSFGNMINKGATTLWEQFDGQYSENHPFLGCCLTWFYRCLAGVNSDMEAPAYKHLIVRPVLADSLESVSYAKMSPYGRVASNVSHLPGRVRIVVDVPVGSSATVYVPAAGMSALSVNGKSAAKAKGVTYTEKTVEGFTVKVKQGHYEIIASKN